MKKILVRIMILVCIAFSVVSVAEQTGVCHVEAASKKKNKAINKKALKAYKKLLSKESINGWGVGNQSKFCLVDINKDGIKELFYTPDDHYHTGIYGYVNGKVKLLLWGSYGGYSANKKLVYTSVFRQGYMSNDYYKYNGKKLKLYASASGYIDENNGIKYEIKGKKVSKKEFEKFEKKVKSKSLNYYQVNNQNIRLYVR